MTGNDNEVGVALCNYRDETVRSTDLTPARLACELVQRAYAIPQRRCACWRRRVTGDAIKSLMSLFIRAEPPWEMELYN